MKRDLSVQNELSIVSIISFSKHTPRVADSPWRTKAGPLSRGEFSLIFHPQYSDSCPRLFYFDLWKSVFLFSTFVCWFYSRRTIESVLRRYEENLPSCSFIGKKGRERRSFECHTKRDHRNKRRHDCSCVSHCNSTILNQRDSNNAVTRISHERFVFFSEH